MYRFLLWKEVDGSSTIEGSNATNSSGKRIHDERSNPRAIRILNKANLLECSAL